MKAQTFLEWSKNKPSLDYYGGAIFDIVDFYSQPFKPELITELFEGWEMVHKIKEDSNQRDVYGYKYCTPEYTILVTIKFWSYYGNGLSIQSDCAPQTLNDFISDCQRAGIELTWKPEIERKYFV